MLRTTGDSGRAVQLSHSMVVLCIYRLLWFISIKAILKENSDLTFSFKLFPFLYTDINVIFTKHMCILT